MKNLKFLAVFLATASFASASLISGITSTSGTAGSGPPPGGGYTGALATDYYVGLGGSMTVSLGASATGYEVTLFDYDSEGLTGKFDVYEVTYPGLGTPFTGDANTDGQFPVISNVVANLSSAGSGQDRPWSVTTSIPSSVSSITITNPGVAGTNLGIFYFDVCAAPVPEPSALMALGFAGMPLAGLAWFRKRRAAVEAE